jgi:hypothetical protein
VTTVSLCDTGGIVSLPRLVRFDRQSDVTGGSPFSRRSSRDRVVQRGVPILRRQLLVTLVTVALAITASGVVVGSGESAERSQTGAASPQAHRVLKGILDDNQILYGDPDQVFAQLKTLKTDVAVVTLWWGGVNGVARRKPVRPADPNDPAYVWDTADRTVRIGQSDGVATIFTIVGTPAWANASAGWNVVPTQMNDLRQFVIAAARRYSGKFKGPDGKIIPPVRRWIAWNEPNNPVFLRPQFIRAGGRWVFQAAKDYARICNTVVAAAKSVVLTNQVACGATSPRGNNQPVPGRPSTSPIAFLRAMKIAGAKGFDAYAHHPYYGARQETPLTPPPPGRRGATPTAVTMGNITALTRELDATYPAARLWISEYGYQTNPPDEMVGVTWAQQASYMAQAWNVVKSIPRIDVFVWFLLKDEVPLGRWQSGLITADGRAKPALKTFMALK